MSKTDHEVRSLYDITRAYKIGERRGLLTAAEMAKTMAEETQAQSPHWQLWGDPDRLFAEALVERLIKMANLHKLPE